MISSAHLPRPASLLAGAILLLVGLFAGACDQMTGSSLGDVEGPPEVDSAALSYSHMPTGTSLPSPGEVPLTNGIIGAEGETPRPKNDSPKTDSSGVESPYGCYLASRPYTDSTRIRSVYLYFPAEMVEAAEGKTKSFVLQMSVAWDGGEADARYAHCVVPEVPGAREVATGQLLRAGEEDAAWGVAGGGSKSASAKGCIQIVYTATTCVGGGGSFPEEHCETETESFTVCGGGDGGGGDGGATDPWPDDDDGGGGSDGSGGDSGEDCTALNPEPGSDCKPDELDVDEKEVCPSDPLADMDIRPTCAGIEGGRFGCTRGDEDDCNWETRSGDDFHAGLDLDADKGTELTPVEGGTVVVTGYLDAFGSYVVIRSSNDEERFFLYAHLSSTSVQQNDTVTEGEKLGETGKSGNADDAQCNEEHLHLEVREGNSAGRWAWTRDSGGKPVDPEKYVGTKFGADGDPVSDACG